MKKYLDSKKLLCLKKNIAVFIMNEIFINSAYLFQCNHNCVPSYNY